MNIAIIGAGPAGLAAIRHCLNENLKCVAFEQSGKVGGLWNYTDNTDVDENGLPVHSSMYQGLRTNLSKELMQFEDFPFKAVEDDEADSFISQTEVLNYINRYSSYFNLLPYVKFYQQVILIDPTPDEKWAVQVRNVKTKEINTDIFDAVIVCNGHYFEPNVPTISGSEDFNGSIVHSHVYRKPDNYKNKKVLLLGAGPSGVDIANKLSNLAKKTFLSYEGEITGRTTKEVIAKPKVKCFNHQTAIFRDGSSEEIDAIIYCTGYKYTFPFCSKKCQLSVEDNWVRPLYKHLILIEHPTLCIINIPNFNCPFPMFGLQIRFFLALLKGQIKITKEEMYEDLKKEKEAYDKTDKPQEKYHVLGPWNQEGYFEDLADTAKIKPIPSVINNIFMHQITYKTGRCKYEILNDDEFKATPIQ